MPNFEPQATPRRVVPVNGVTQFQPLPLPMNVLPFPGTMWADGAPNFGGKNPPYPIYDPGMYGSKNAPISRSDRREGRGIQR